MDLQDLIDGVYSRNYKIGSDVIRQALDKKAEDTKASAVERAEKALSFGQQELGVAVKNLNYHRKKEADAKKRVDAIDRAFRYFAETGNPLPLYRETDIWSGRNFLLAVGYKDEDDIMNSEKHDAWKVPSDWKQSSEA
jgi:hypothetical protein